MTADIWIYAVVPVLLTFASAVMALAWLAHLRFRHWRFRTAMLASWLLVLPEYVLNVYATRLGHEHFSGAQMASLHLSMGVVCVVVVAKYVLGESVSRTQAAGFLLMAAAITLIMWR
jgi:uncharacterized protein (DUF486 family)